MEPKDIIHDGRLNQPEPQSKFKLSRLSKSVKKFIDTKPILFFFLVIVTLSVLALVSSLLYVKLTSNNTTADKQESADTAKKSPSKTPTPTEEESDDEDSEIPANTNIPTQKPTATSTPKPTATMTPTPVPTRTPNPPKMKITYPVENQSIELNSSQTFCVADSPDGGDNNGLVRRYNINNGGWTDYKSMTTLCYSPSEGSNNLKLQYKNYYDEESPEYSINFTFHRT